MAKKKKTPKRFPMDAEASRARKRVLGRKYATIRELAEALIQLRHHTYEDRSVGYAYADIHAMILRKLPRVTINGPHHGKPTKMPIKELHEIACDLNRNGVKLPLRPRRKKPVNKSKKD